MNHLKNSTIFPIVSKTKNPAELELLLKNLLTWEPNQRFTLNQILQSGWINDSSLITVKYLDKINSY
jgi:serine/threonine protein kinase